MISTQILESFKQIFPEADSKELTELLYFKKLGNDFLALDENQIKQLIEANSLFDIEVIE